MSPHRTPALLLTVFLIGLAPGLSARAEDLATLARGFQSPPPAARPWVYWFWLNGNITRAGITADLEAMQRVGIGGVLIMEVDQGAPKGPADFAGRIRRRPLSPRDRQRGGCAGSGGRGASCRADDRLRQLPHHPCE